MKNFSRFISHFSSGVFVSRISGFAREIAMAFFFGVTPLIASFWMAFRFAHLLRRFFAEGALSITFLPYFASLRKENPEKAAHFFSRLSSKLTLLLVGLIFFIELGLVCALAIFPLRENTQELLQLFMIFLPSIPFICLHALNCSFLQSEDRFFLPSVSSSFVNGIWIFAAFLLYKFKIPLAIHFLAASVVVAFAFQYFTTLPSTLSFLRVKKQSIEAKKESLALIKEMLVPMSFALLGVAAMQLNSFCDAIFARMISSEGPCYLWYAIRLQQLPLALFGVAIASILLPQLTKAKDGDKLWILRESLKKAWSLLLFATCYISVTAFSLVSIVYHHGQFSESACQETSNCLLMYSFALVPHTFVLIFSSWYYHKKETKLPALVAGISLISNLILNSLFVWIFQDAASVAFATSISALINALMLGRSIKKEVGFFWKEDLFFYLKTLVIALGISLFGWLGKAFLYREDQLNTLEHCFVIGVQGIPFLCGMMYSLGFFQKRKMAIS